MNKFFAISFAAVLSLLGTVCTAAFATDNATATAVASPAPKEAPSLAIAELKGIFVPGSVIDYVTGEPGDIMQIRLSKDNQAEADQTALPGRNHRTARTIKGTWRLDEIGLLCRTFEWAHQGAEVCSSVSVDGSQYTERRVGGRSFTVSQPKVAAEVK